MTANSAPFYTDWQFWSALAALLALVLSQLPPIHVLLRRAKLRCEAFSRLHLTHKVGNASSHLHLINENVGGRAIRVKTIFLTFQKSGGQPFTLPVQNYLRTPDATDNVMFTPFRLEPGEEWAHVLTFFNLYSREDEKEYRRLESAIRTDILSQKEVPENRDRICEAAPTSVDLAMKFFDRKFQWSPGEYELELRVQTDRPEADIVRSYRFTLFESESAELRGYSDSYKYGAGVYWVSQAQPGILVPIQET